MDDEARPRIPLALAVLLPPVLVNAGVLTFSRRVWTTMIESHNRSGKASLNVAAHVHLAALGAGLALYFLASAWQGGASFAWRPGLRTDAGDVFVAKQLARLLALGILYYGAWVLLREYVL
jgi:hypothetical protein